MDKKIDIIEDADGKGIVVISDLRFRGRRSVDWNIVENCLKEYIGGYDMAGTDMIHVLRSLFMMMQGKWSDTMFLRQEY